MCEWGNPNHTYFHIANLFLALTYFCPNNLRGLIVLRLFLGTAGVFFSLWAGIILCSPDTLGWNLVFSVINYGHVAYLWYSMRPIKFSEEHELLYAAVFEQLGIARYQFAPLAGLSFVKHLKKEEVYSHENQTHGENISIVTAGRYGLIRFTEFRRAFALSNRFLINLTQLQAFPVTCIITSIQ